MTRTVESVKQHMQETLVPDPAVVMKFGSKPSVSPDQDNVAGYSILAIDSETNDNIRMSWVGDEVVTDPGLTFATRAEAFDGCRKLAAQGAKATAFVVHWTSGDWSVFINPGRP